MKYQCGDFSKTIVGATLGIQVEISMLANHRGICVFVVALFMKVRRKWVPINRFHCLAIRHSSVPLQDVLFECW